MFSENLVNYSRYSELYRKYSSDHNWFFPKVDLTSSKMLYSGTGLTSWFKYIIYTWRTHIIAKFKWHWPNNLFEMVIYRQQFNLFPFISSYMNPYYSNSDKSHMHLSWSVSNFDFNLLFKLEYQAELVYVINLVSVIKMGLY